MGEGLEDDKSQWFGRAVEAVTAMLQKAEPKSETLYSISVEKKSLGNVVIQILVYTLILSWKLNVSKMQQLMSNIKSCYFTTTETF